MLVTAGWAGLTGGGESDALGRGWEQHVHPDDLPVIASTWQRDGAEGTSLDVEFRIRNRHGHWHWVRARGARVSQDSLPAWAGREVTDQGRYYNLALADRPFSQWSAEERG